MKPVSRKTSTLLNLSFQYGMMGLMIVRGIILPPLALKFIDPHLLGAWYASGNIVQWLMISEGGAWLFLRQKTALEFGRNDHNALSAVIGTGGLLLALLGVFIILLSLLVAPHVPVWLHVDDQYRQDLIAAFIMTTTGMGLSLPACIPRAVEHGLQKQIAVNVSYMLAELVSIMASITLLFSGYGILALGAGPIVRESVHNIINWPILASTLRSMRLRPRISIAYIRSMSGQVGWTFLRSLSGALRGNVDALIVSQVFGNSSVLVVEWTKRAWGIFYGFITRASGSFTPTMAHLYGEGDLSKFRNISARLFSVIAVSLSMALGFGLTLNQPFIKLWVGSEFFAGYSYNMLLGLATVAAAIGFTLLEVLFATGNIKRPAIAQLTQTIARVGVLFALVPSIGILSIPLSTLITETLGGVIYLAYEWKRTLRFPVREMLSRLMIVFRIVAATVVFAIIWNLLPKAATWGWLFVHAAIVGTSLLLIFYAIEPFVRVSMGDLSVKLKYYVNTKR